MAGVVTAIVASGRREGRFDLAMDGKTAAVVSLELIERFGPLDRKRLSRALKLGVLVDLGDGRFEAPSPALLHAAAGAHLLVVARRGAGGFRGLGFGSTADQVVRHSPCPVVVVPVGDGRT